MSDPGNKSDPAASARSSKSTFIAACILVFLGYTILAGRIPGLLQIIYLTPVAVLAFLLLYFIPRTKEGNAGFGGDYDFIEDILRAVITDAPAFGAYILAPAIVLICLVVIVKFRTLFFFFQSEGSAAGLFIPIFLWVIVLVGFMVAGALYFKGIKRLKDGNGKSTSQR